MRLAPPRVIADRSVGGTLMFLMLIGFHRVLDVLFGEDQTSLLMNRILTGCLIFIVVSGTVAWIVSRRQPRSSA